MARVDRRQGDRQRGRRWTGPDDDGQAMICWAHDRARRRAAAAEGPKRHTPGPAQAMTGDDGFDDDVSTTMTDDGV